MSRHVVIGTAGHVDHGKTALVRSLTGVETDRWEEEKRRGITIDLGFAPLELSDGLTASIVDVPGHEAFVRNMVAGAGGVDVALLVVAADEGVMPQTVEHLAILEFLGVRTGLPVVTKADLVERDWLDLVVSDLRDRLAGSQIVWEAPVIASAVTGEGMDTLARSMAAAARRAAERSSDDLFRLPVDRVFSVAGAGTVVTGTTWSGSVNVGDEVRVLPREQRGRVRGVEVHGQQRDSAEPGRRTALALAGVDRAPIARGSVVVTDATWRESRAVDVLLTLLPHARPLTQRSRVRFHLGTAEVMARVTPVGREIGPGSTAPARLRLEGPIVARWGDRGVVRSYSPVTTVGGCVIVDPWPPPRPRRPVRLEERSNAADTQRARALVGLAGKGGLSVSDLPIRLGIHPRSVHETVADLVTGDVRQVARSLVVQEVIEGLRRTILASLSGYHQEHPLEPGMSRELLRVAGGSTAFAEHVLEELADEGRILLEGGTARLADFRATLSRDETGLGDRIRQELVAAGWQGRTPAELSEPGDQGRARDLLEFFVRQDTVRRVGHDRYYDRGALDGLRETLVEEVRRLGRATPAQLKGKTGLSRKYLIPVLEWLDACGFTVREGDARRLGVGSPTHP